MKARLNKTFQNAVDSKKLPGCGGIILDKAGNVVWKGAYGSTNISDPTAAAFTAHTPLFAFSCTKLPTSIIALQLLEEGKLTLDDPVEKYCPDFAGLPVLEGFDSNGKAIHRSPQTKATILHLLTHTSGLSYDCFNPSMLQWRIANNLPLAATMAAGTRSTYAGPLLFEPGQQYCYGLSTDWVGFVIEAITGKKLVEVYKERIIGPLQLKNSTEVFNDEKPRMTLHMRAEDGSLTGVPNIKPLSNPEVYGGGEFLVTTMQDYSQILLSILNGGEHPILKVRLLKEETVQNYLFTDLLSQICSSDQVGRLASSMPITNSSEFLPGVKKTWSAALLLNEEDCPKGRSAGSGAWAGMGNCYYFIDPAAGRLALFCTCVFPFLDPESLHVWDEMERALYGHAGKKSPGELGGNHGPWERPVSSL